MLLPTLPLIVSLAAPAGDLAPTLRVEHPDGHGLVTLVVADRGRSIEVWLEGRCPTEEAPAGIEVHLGEWSVSDGREELEGLEIGPVALAVAPPADGDDELAVTRYRSVVYTLELDDIEPVLFEILWTVGARTYRDRGRLDGLDEDARLLGWTAFDHGGLRARASFWEGTELCTVRLELWNPGTEELTSPPLRPRVLSRSCRYVEVAGVKPPRARAGRAAGPVDVSSTLPDDTPWSWAPGELRRFALPVDVAPATGAQKSGIRKSGEDAPDRPPLARWSVTIELPSLEAGLEPVPLTFDWRRETGIGVRRPDS